MYMHMRKCDLLCVCRCRCREAAGGSGQEEGCGTVTRGRPTLLFLCRGTAATVGR